METLAVLSRKCISSNISFYNIETLSNYLPRILVQEIKNNYWEDYCEYLNCKEELPPQSEDKYEEDTNLVVSTEYCLHSSIPAGIQKWCCSKCIHTYLRNYKRGTVFLYVSTVRSACRVSRAYKTLCGSCGNIVEIKVYDGKGIKLDPIYFCWNDSYSVSGNVYPPDGRSRNRKHYFR